MTREGRKEHLNMLLDNADCDKASKVATIFLQHMAENEISNSDALVALAATLNHLIRKRLLPMSAQDAKEVQLSYDDCVKLFGMLAPEVGVRAVAASQLAETTQTKQ